ncbi:hypothetical protein AYO44_18590, partial [Planctomycetaceae bacterium SCGC AG-212-F19]
FRFWLERTSISGTLDVFDYGIVWLEYAPFFVALLVETWLSQRQNLGNSEPPGLSRRCEISPSSAGRNPAARLAEPVGGRRGMTFVGVLIALLGVLAGLGVALLVLHWNRPRVVVDRPDGPYPRVALDEVDHSSWDALLQKYVDDRGLVAYRRWKDTPADVAALDRYLARLSAVFVDAPAERAAQIAYWINAYNALTIKGILREYPTSSIRNHTTPVGGYNLWRDFLLDIDGRKYALDDIEHSMLRPMGEPRIHFALVCAAKGCPPLWNRAWTAANLEDAFTASAKRFFARPTNFRADVANRTVFVSELFDWYGTDFAPTSIDQVRTLRPYMPMPEEVAWIDAGNVTVKYLTYDWSLNDQEPTNEPVP